MQITVTSKALETMTTLLISKASKASKPPTPYSLALQLHSPGGCSFPYRQNMLMTLLLLALLKA